VKGIPDPAADPPLAATAGVTADVSAGVPLAIPSDLRMSGGDAIVVAGGNRRLTDAKIHVAVNPQTNRRSGTGRQSMKRM